MMQMPISSGLETGSQAKLRRLVVLVLAALLATGEGRFAVAADPTLWPVANRPWPFNGEVTNAWDRPLEAWSDTRGAFIIEPGAWSGAAEDVDYVKIDGQWYKIGVHHMRVDPDGQVTGYECVARSPGGPCV